MKKEKLSIVIPVYNEEKTINLILEKIHNLKISGIEIEILVVNDASKDSSKKIIQELTKKYSNLRYFEHKENKGKGAALRTGFNNISGDYVVIQDADLEYNPEDLKKLIIPLMEGKADVVYGSRMLGKITGFQISSHYYGNKFLSLITSLLFGRKVTDMETCYKMMKSNVIKELNLKSNKFDIEPEITAKILRKKYKFQEVPIDYKARSFLEGKKITAKDGIFALKTLLKYRFFTK